MNSIIVLHGQTLNDLSDIVFIIRIGLLGTVNGLMEQASYQQIR